MSEPKRSALSAWWAVAALCTAQFMLIVDVVVVNVALPAIRQSLELPTSQLALTAAAYTVTFGSLLITAGKAGDVYGRRRVLTLGLAVFTIASLAAGLTGAPWQFFTARAAQGVGAALVSANALALLGGLFTDTAARNRAMGLWAAVGSAGAVAGQVLAGILVDTVGWRWIFLINVPLGIIGVFLAGRTLTDARDDTQSLPATGALLLVAGLTPSVLALALAGSGQTRDYGVALGAAGSLLLIAFLVHQRRTTEKLVPGMLLKVPGVAVANVALGLSAAAVAGSLFFTTLYMQEVLGLSALAVGMTFAPITLVIMVVSGLASRLVSKYGARPPLVSGLALAGVGMVWLSRASHEGTLLLDVLPGLLAVAVGSGLSYAPTFVAATSLVPAQQQGTASGLISTSQELGPAMGLAVITAVAGATTAAASDVGYNAGFLTASALSFAAAAAVCGLRPGLGRVASTPASEERVLSSPA